MREGELERRIVTVLFADLVGFTTLSERLDPEDVAAVQDAYFAPVRETIGRYRGRLEKFIGDAAMAVFGLPKTADDDAQRAVRAGLALVSAVEQLPARIGLEEGDLRLRVGINTGEVVLTQSGAEEWRVTGDTVNTAARLQTAAPPGGVLIGETTALAAADAAELAGPEALELKGKAETVRAWRAVAVRPEPSREHAMGRLRAPTIGRDDELAALERAMERVRPGSAERHVVVGPPGVGKTRLVEESMRRSVESVPERLAWRVRLRPEVVAPFQPIAQLVLAALAGAGLDFRDGIPGRAETLIRDALSRAGVTRGRAEVVTGEILGLITPAADSEQARVPRKEREVLFRAWIEGLDALAAATTQVWVVEDVHWAGGDFLAFLDLAGRSGCSGGRLVVATARPSLLDRAPAWCDPAENTAISFNHLAPLSGVDVRRLIAALVGDVLSPELEHRIADRSDGNPLFIEELLRMWVSAGTLVSDNGTWRLLIPASDVAFPTTVHAIYAGQIDDLPPGPRQVVRRASVAGRRFPSSALEPLEVHEAAHAVDSLLRGSLLTKSAPDPLLGAALSYRHALLRDAGYASLPRSDRARLHIRLARWLENFAEARHGEIAEMIASHYATSYEATPALARNVGDGVDLQQVRSSAARWFERAADAAFAVAAQDAARSLFRRALEFTAPAEVLDLARRWERLGDATAFAGDMDEGGAAFEEAANLYRSILHSAEWRQARLGYARATTSLGRVWCEQIRFEDAVDLAERALALLGDDRNGDTARLLYLRAWGRYCFKLVPEIRPDLERALSLARGSGDTDLEQDALYLLGGAKADLGELTRNQLLEDEKQVIALAERLHDWPRLVRSLRMHAQELIEQDVDAAKPLLRQAREIAADHGLTEDLAWGWYGEGEAALLSGTWGTAIDSGLQALDLAERNAYHRVAVRTWFVLVPVAVTLGLSHLFERAKTWFEEHHQFFPESPYGLMMHGAVDVWLGRAGLVQPKVADAARMLEVWDESQLLPSLFLAADTVVEHWLSNDPHGEARTFAEKMMVWSNHPLTSEFGKASSELVSARTLLAGGASDQAAETGIRALSRYRRCKAPWWIARSIRFLDSARAASPHLKREADSIEQTLGLKTKTSDATARSGT